MRFLRTNTAIRLTVGPFLDKTDGVTPEVALTVTACKLALIVDDANVPTLVLDVAPTASGGANDMVHITNDDAGFYDLELAAANLNYLGRAMLAITDAATHCPVFHEFMILPAMIYDSLVLGTDRLDTNVTHMNDVAASGVTTIKAVQGLAVDGVITTLTNLPAITASWLTATGIAADAITAAKLAADVATEIQSGLATAANLATVAGYLDTEIAAIKAKTDQFVFTVANQVDANTLSGGGGLDAAGVRAAVGLASANLDTQLGDLPTNAELATSQAAADDATLAAIAALNNLSSAQVTTAATAATPVAASVSGAVGSVTGNVGGNVVGSVGSVTGLTSAIIAAAVEAAILDEGDATALLAAIAAKVEAFLINEGDASATLAAIAAAVRTNLATELARIDVGVGTRLATAGYTAPPSAVANASQVRTELATELARIDVATSTRMATYVQPTGFLAANFATGLILTAAYDAAKTAATQTSVNLIKTQTDKMTFNPAGIIVCNINYVNDIGIDGAGTSSDPWGPAA